MAPEKPSYLYIFGKDELDMDMAKFQATHQWIKDELKSSVEFWLKYGLDKEHGGV